jgi:hypothetical protein
VLGDGGEYVLKVGSKLSSGLTGVNLQKWVGTWKLPPLARASGGPKGCSCLAFFSFVVLPFLAFIELFSLVEVRLLGEPFGTFG